MLSRSFVASYAVVLRPPHAARTFGMTLVGRSSYGVVFLAYGAFRWRASAKPGWSHSRRALACL